MSDKICFIIVSHGKLNCYEHQSYFFNRFSKIDNYDVIIFDNSNATEDEIKKYTTNFNVKPTIFSQRQNPGYYLGNFYALREVHSKIQLDGYKYIVHMTNDSFIVDENYLNDHMVNMDIQRADILTNQFCFLPEHHPYLKKPTMCLGGDFFVYNPRSLSFSFWNTLCQIENLAPEYTFYKLATELEMIIFYWIRMHPTVDGRILCAPTEEQRKGYRYRYFADTAGILHTHDLEDLEKYK
jgi:hypothetical protein